jgi:hypothetical protein
MERLLIGTHDKLPAYSLLQEVNTAKWRKKVRRKINEAKALAGETNNKY